MTPEARNRASCPQVTEDNSTCDPNCYEWRHNVCVKDMFSIWNKTKASTLPQLAVWSNSTMPIGNYYIFCSFYLWKVLPRDCIYVYIFLSESTWEKYLINSEQNWMLFSISSGHFKGVYEGVYTCSLKYYTTRPTHTDTRAHMTMTTRMKRTR